MSHKDTKNKKPKSHRGDNSERRPLQPVSVNARNNSVNSSREQQGSSTDITESLRGLSLVDKNGGRGSNSSPGGAQASRTRSATQAEKSATKALKFIKVKISGTFGFDFQPAVLKSYMASSSSSSQMPGLQDGGSSAQNAKFMKSELFGNDFNLVITTAFGWKDNTSFQGILDTGATNILVNRQMFTEMGFKEELDNSLVGNDKYMTARFPDPNLNIGTVDTPLHKSSFTLGGRNGYFTVKEQNFYVLERAPFAVLVGLGTPIKESMHGHTLEDAPTLLQNIKKEKGLRQIMGFDVFPWSDDVDEPDLLKGSSMDFGGKDESRYDKATLRYVACSIDYRIELRTITYANPSGKPVDLRVKFSALIDSGTPYIALPVFVWQEFEDCLKRNGVNVFEYDNPRLRTIEKKDFAKLRTLSFHLVDVDGNKFAIHIPPAGQVFPPSYRRENDRLVLTVVPISDHNVLLLGVALFQRYYMVLDLTTKQYRVGFATKEKTDYVNPSLQKILKKYPQYPQISPAPKESRGSANQRK